MRWARTALCTSAVSMMAFLALGSSQSSATMHVSRPAQAASVPALTLAAQSPFIEPTGPWFHMTVNVGDQQVPASQLRVTVTFYSRIEAASELAQATSGLPDESALNRVPITLPITVNATSRSASICVTVLPGPSVAAPPAPAGAGAAEACPSGAPIVYLNCTSGNGTCGQIHPVSVALQRMGTTNDISRFTTFLTYQEPTVEGTGQLLVAMVMPVGQGATTAESTIAQVTAHRDVPMTLAVSPTTAINLKSRGAKGRSLQQLNELTESGGDQLLSEPYVPIDVAALARAGLTGEISTQLQRGTQLLHQAGLHPVSGSWIDTTSSLADADTGNLTAGLQAARATHLVVSDAVLANSANREYPNQDYTAAQPFSLDLDHGAHIDAVATDSTVDARFSADPGDPVLAANQLLADLMFVHFENVFLPKLRGVALDPPANWQPTAAFNDVFLSGLTGNPGLAPVTLSQLFAQVPAGGNGESAQRHLQSGSSSRQGLILKTAALRISTDRSHLSSFVSAVVDNHHANPPAVLGQLSDALLTTENATFTSAQRTASMLNFQQRFSQVLGTISLAPEQTITFTSRTAPIPVTVLHTASYSVSVVLTLDSDKFTFPDGNTRTLTLNRPTTPVRIQARARSSGDGLPVDVTLRTPDGQLVIAHTSVAVHSTSISIVGIGITALAGLTLLVWWGRTWRRSRRQRPRAH
jgi:hypothetical protein